MLLAAGCGRISFDDPHDAAAALSYPATVLASDPFVYYRLDETNDDPMALDATGHGRQEPFSTTNAGVVERGFAGALMAPNEPGTAVHFDGTGNGGNDEGYLDLPDAQDDAVWAALWSGDFTIEMFVQMLEPPTDRTLGLVVCEDYHGDTDPPLPLGSGFRTGIGDESALRFWNTEASGATDIRSVSIDPNTWYHLVVVHDRTDVRFYINGVDRSPVGHAAADYVPPHDMSECGIGSFHGMPTHVVLDEIAFYQRALDATDIARHFAASGR
jgi:hypothetical protein